MRKAVRVTFVICGYIFLFYIFMDYFTTNLWRIAKVTETIVIPLGPLLVLRYKVIYLFLNKKSSSEILNKCLSLVVKKQYFLPKKGELPIFYPNNVKSWEIIYKIWKCYNIKSLLKNLRFTIMNCGVDMLYLVQSFLSFHSI